MFARKHMNWYLKQLAVDHPDTAAACTLVLRGFNACTSNQQQLDLLHQHQEFITLNARMLAA